MREPVEHRPTVMLIGAGTSDYIAQALTFVLRQEWGCEVIAAASTDLLPNMEAYMVPGRRYPVDLFFAVRGIRRRAWRCWSERWSGTRVWRTWW